MDTRPQRGKQVERRVRQIPVTRRLPRPAPIAKVPPSTGSAAARSGRSGGSTPRRAVRRAGSETQGTHSQRGDPSRTRTGSRGAFSPRSLSVPDVAIGTAPVRSEPARRSGTTGADAIHESSNWQGRLWSDLRIVPRARRVAIARTGSPRGTRLRGREALRARRTATSQRSTLAAIRRNLHRSGPTRPADDADWRKIAHRRMRRAWSAVG